MSGGAGNSAPEVSGSASDLMVVGGGQFNAEARATVEQVTVARGDVEQAAGTTDATVVLAGGLVVVAAEDVTVELAVDRAATIGVSGGGALDELAPRADVTDGSAGGATGSGVELARGVTIAALSSDASLDPVVQRGGIEIVSGGNTSDRTIAHGLTDVVAGGSVPPEEPGATAEATATVSPSGALSVSNGTQNSGPTRT
jgi:hypothetical protein